MANKRISQLPVATAVDAGLDVVPASQADGVTRQVPVGLLGPPRRMADGAGGAAMSDLRWDRGAYRTNIGHMADVPLAPTRAFVVPAGYYGYLSQIAFTNTAAVAISGTVYLMGDSATTPTADDKFVGPTSVGVGDTIQNVIAVLDEGWSAWYSATVAGLHMSPTLMLIPKDTPGVTLTPVLVKDVPLIETTLYTVTGDGQMAFVAAGMLHNRGAGSATLTSRLHRASDGAVIVCGNRYNQSANGSALWYGGAGLVGAATLLQGDSLTVQASAAGFNVTGVVVERAIAGVTT